MVKTFSKQSPKTIFRTSTLSLCLSTLTTLSTHFSATNIPTPSVFALLPIQNSLYLLPIAPKNLHPEPLHRVSWTHATSIRLSANASTSSPDLSVSESTFQVPTLKGQPFHSLSALGGSSCTQPFALRYDTRCYFNVRSKADISQLNLPHGML